MSAPQADVENQFRLLGVAPGPTYGPLLFVNLGQHPRWWSRSAPVIGGPPNGIIVPWDSASSLSTMCN